jgi:hypothetical protein
MRQDISKLEGTCGVSMAMLVGHWLVDLEDCISNPVRTRTGCVNLLLDIDLRKMLSICTV